MSKLINMAVSRRIQAASTGTIDLTEDGVSQTPHVFIAVKFITAGIIVTPGAGTYTIDVRGVGMPDYEAITDGTAIDATAATETLSYATNAEELRYTPTGVTGADEVQITVTGNYA
jgi:hypothetical protein